jgi:voltage-gated potassium channel
VNSDPGTAWARGRELPMTLFSFLWLLLVGAAIQRVAGPVYRDHALDISIQEIVVFAAVLGGLWLTVVAECFVSVLWREPGRSGWRDYRGQLWICLFPALRMVLRSRAVNDRMWFPALGWHEVNRELRLKLERFFSIPMIVIALMILPVLVVEYFWGDTLKQGEHVWTLILLDSCTVVIWVAFTTEFIVMCAVAESKFAYCKLHWLDLAIILLPMISFARALRFARLARLGRLGRMSRLYRLRGLAIRAFRALLLLDVIARLIGRTPQKELVRLRGVLATKEAEIEDLRRDIARLEAQIASQPAQAAESCEAEPKVERTLAENSR